jgi:SAM-dependent methyltransferase
MGLYAKFLFPRVLEWTLDTKVVQRERKLALASAGGVTLEIGFGTGLNLPCYPAAVTKVIGVDPERMLADRVRRRIDAAPMAVEQFNLDASNRLPFEPESFDTVVSTFTLCSIDEVAAALSEIHRVLKPSGKFLFLEHGRSDRAKVARWQDRLNPIQRVVGRGCNLNRPIDQLILGAGFELNQLDRYVMADSPALFASMYRGVGVRGERLAPTSCPRGSEAVSPSPLFLPQARK